MQAFFHLCDVLAVTSTRNVTFLTVDMVSLPIRLIFIVSAVTVTDPTQSRLASERVRNVFELK